jgi:hypothetical protein
MLQSEVIDLLNRTIFPPGWKVSAEPSGSGVRIHLLLKTMDSSYPDFQGNYTRPTLEDPLDFDFTLHPQRYRTPEELLYMVLQLKNGIQEHEDREFVRVRAGGEWVAPFHPHKYSGDMAWYQAGGNDTNDSLQRLVRAA